MSGTHECSRGGVDNAYAQSLITAQVMEWLPKEDSLRQRETAQQQASVLQVVFLGKRLPYILAAVSADGCLRLWNVKLVQLLAEVKVSQDSVTAVCVDPAQTQLVAADSAGFMYTYSIAAWKGAKGKQAVWPQHTCML